MGRQHATKTGKPMRMKFSRIISACPERARKWHIQVFAMFYIANKADTFSAAARTPPQKTLFAPLAPLRAERRRPGAILFAFKALGFESG